MKLQAPLEFAEAVPSQVVPSYSTTTLLAAAVPVTVSVLALVMPSPVTALSGENEATVGAAIEVDAEPCCQTRT